MKKILLFLTTLFFFCQTQLLLPLLSSATPLPSQLPTLISIKSTIIDPSNHLYDWKIPSNNHQDRIWCSWRGITCHPKTSQITSLDLSNLNLSGTISPQTFQLTELTTINISYNTFNSTFPLGISKLRFLKIFDAFDNSFSGPLPQELIELPSLEQLNLGGNNFSGRIPSSYGNLKKLKFLTLAGNALEGSLPTTIGLLSELKHMELGINAFSGTLPVEIKMLAKLKYLDISAANISGVIPDLSNLTMLETLILFNNRLSGEIPSSIGKLTSLKAIDLSINELTGPIPSEITKLLDLEELRVTDNKLNGEIPKGIGELPKLNSFMVSNNSFSGTLPPKFGSNGLLQRFDISINSLQGSIPMCICRGNHLVTLNLFNNNLNSTLPSSLANCSSLIRVRIENNNFTGTIPQALTMLPNLKFLDLSNNKFRGEIPRELGNLQYLNISGNSFQSTLPRNLWKASNLRIFSASFAKITGRIPSFVGCKMIYKIQLHGNFIKGIIPFSINECKELSMLNLHANELKGSIPNMSSLPLIDVDISQNNLTGTIPSSLSNCITLESLNVSFNSLAGPIPSSGILPNLDQSSYTGNQNLCGRPLDKPCGSDGGKNEHEVHGKKKIDGTAIGVILGITLWVIVLFAGAYFYKKYSIRYKGNSDQHDGLWELTAFQQLNFTVDDLVERMKTAEILGRGSSGTVFKAEMPDGKFIAVKVILTKQDAVSTIMRRGVLAEVGVLGGNVRHRNIVKLLGCCSKNETMMLLYPYMENGNLDEFLHAENNGENNWVTRYKIALGVAHGISYLHHDCNPVVVHRDIKPRNILLDGQMEAKLADFGVAKLIQIDEVESVIIGTYGYIAPEYANTLQVDEKSDIYSYGVVLMEIVSGKRVMDQEFGEGKNIVDWVESKLKTEGGINGIFDKNAGADRDSVKKEMTNMLRIALLCTSRNPADRPSMKDVLSMLQKDNEPERESIGIDIYNFEVGESSGNGQT